MLLIVAMFWGSSCMLTKLGLGEINEFNLLALRFAIAFILAAIVFLPRILKTPNFKALLSRSAIIGFLLFVTFTLNNFGIKITTASNAGFLTCLEGVFVPFLIFLIYKEAVEKKVFLSVILSFAGVYLLTMSGNISLNLGDILCILCSVAFALQIIVTGKFTKEVDPITLGVFQLGFAGIYSLICTFIFETPTFPQTGESWLVVILLSIFCTAMAFIMQSFAQRYTTPTHTGIIFAMEPVFAAFFSFLILGEILQVRGYIGAALMVASIIIMETDYVDKLFAKL